MAIKKTKSKKEITIGLALSGGGVRGYAHVGALKALEENGIKVDFIAGTSIGALIGSLYCYYKDAKKVEEIVLGMEWRDLFTIRELSLKGGLVKGDQLEAYLKRELNKTEFGGLKIPLKIITTDYLTGEKVELMEGPLAPAIQASCAFPLFFAPVNHAGRILYDGGMTDPVPCQTVKEMGVDIILAVNLNNNKMFDPGKKIDTRLRSVIGQALRTMEKTLAKESTRPADIVIEPGVDGLEFFGIKDFIYKSGVKLVEVGYSATMQEMPKIKKLIEKRTKEV